MELVDTKANGLAKGHIEAVDIANAAKVGYRLSVEARAAELGLTAEEIVKLDFPEWFSKKLSYDTDFGQLSLDPERGLAKSPLVQVNPIPLTPHETAILAGLLKEPAKVFSDEEIVALFWAPKAVATSRLKDIQHNRLVHTTRLRRKLGDHKQNDKPMRYGRFRLIHTIPSRGISLTPSLKD